jgi:hypothetical protein
MTTVISMDLVVHQLPKILRKILVYSYFRQNSTPKIWKQKGVNIAYFLDKMMDRYGNSKS